MIRAGKNIKDRNLTVADHLKDTNLQYVSYAKVDKLITALYIVTDVIDKDEPLRNKLRTLGANLLTDTYSNFSSQTSHLNKLTAEVNELLTFLNLAETLGQVSAMNCRILRNEFLELKQAISVKFLDPKPVIEDLLKEEVIKPEPSQKRQAVSFKETKRTSSYPKPIRLGVQDAGTFIQSLSDRISPMSDISILTDTNSEYEILKKQRRNEITKIIKYQSNNVLDYQGATITDIKNKAGELKDLLGITALLSCGEKTIQRELVAMVGENVLHKTGSKRWSRYLLSTL